MWDKDTVRRYEEWYDTPEGAFAFYAQKRLLGFLMSGWRRRGHTLLDVGCGPGLVLDFFHNAGLDVTGIDQSPAMLAAARRRMGTAADLHLGSADHLPFDDCSFDYVSLVTVLEFSDDPQKVLEEAFRVAAQGVIITMLNKWSWYYLSHGLRFREKHWGKHSDTLREPRWFTPFAMRAMIRAQAGDKPLTMRSVLPGPVFSWRQSQPWRLINSSLLPYGFGSYAGIRVDLCDIKTVTPIAAPVKPLAAP